MGHGDDIIATSFARGAHDRGRRIAFGDGQRIIWGPFSREIFKNNPNIAPPGCERDRDVQWIKYYKGHRGYNSSGGNRWIWNYDFKVRPGEIYFNNLEFSNSLIGIISNIVLIEPNVPDKPCAPNKQWPVERFRFVAEKLSRAGYEVVQPEYGGPNKVATGIKTRSFREGMLLLSRAKLAILPEGGLHHAAAAIGIPAIVLFGGFVPPSVLGYDFHTNLTGGVDACGSFNRCQHCIDAMARISCEEVLTASEKRLP